MKKLPLLLIPVICIVSCEAGFFAAVLHTDKQSVNSLKITIRNESSIFRIDSIVLIDVKTGKALDYSKGYNFVNTKESRELYFEGLVEGNKYIVYIYNYLERQHSVYFILQHREMHIEYNGYNIRYYFYD